MRRADRTTLTRSIILEERLDYYTQPCLPKTAEIKESLTLRDIQLLVRIFSLTIYQVLRFDRRHCILKYWKMTGGGAIRGSASQNLPSRNTGDSSSIIGFPAASSEPFDNIRGLYAAVLPALLLSCPYFTLH